MAFEEFDDAFTPIIAIERILARREKWVHTAVRAQRAQTPLWHETQLSTKIPQAPKNVGGVLWMASGHASHTQLLCSDQGTGAFTFSRMISGDIKLTGDPLIFMMPLDPTFAFLQWHTAVAVFLRPKTCTD